MVLMGVDVVECYCHARALDVGDMHFSFCFFFSRGRERFTHVRSKRLRFGEIQSEQSLSTVWSACNTKRDDYLFEVTHHSTGRQAWGVSC